MRPFEGGRVVRVEPTNLEHPILVFDSENTAQLPSNLRSTEDPYRIKIANPPTRDGLETLHASAARQFSELDLETTLQRMSGEVYIVDLRQEPHGFVDGRPISWYGFRNRTHADLLPDSIEALEEKWLSEIRVDSRAKVHRIVGKTEGSVTEYIAYDTPVSKAETERELVERLGLQYARFFVTDHHTPSHQCIDQFLYFVRSLPENAWLHFHCRGGKGRASTFMVLYDIIRNGKNVGLDDIVERHALIGEKNLFRVSETPEKLWKYNQMAERREFVKEFFAFINDPDRDGVFSWTEWSSLRGTA